MEKYIKSHGEENLIEFYTLCGRDAQGNKIMLDRNKMIEHASYIEVKEWFLKTYPEIKQYQENIKNILNKKTA